MHQVSRETPCAPRPTGTQVCKHPSQAFANPNQAAAALARFVTRVWVFEHLWPRPLPVDRSWEPH